jgi:hypothetical protein
VQVYLWKALIILKQYLWFNPLFIENESGVEVLSPLKPIGQQKVNLAELQ